MSKAKVDKYFIFYEYLKNWKGIKGEVLREIIWFMVKNKNINYQPITTDYLIENTGFSDKPIRVALKSLEEEGVIGTEVKQDKNKRTVRMVWIKNDELIRLYKLTNHVEVNKEAIESYYNRLNQLIRVTKPSDADLDKADNLSLRKVLAMMALYQIFKKKGLTFVVTPELFGHIFRKGMHSDKSLSFQYLKQIDDSEVTDILGYFRSNRPEYTYYSQSEINNIKSTFILNM